MRLEIDRAESMTVPSDEAVLKAAEALLKRDDVMLPEGVVEVRLCGLEEMLELNRRYHDSDAVTDVLAFEMFDEDPATGEIIVGSIAVNHDLAAARARDWLAAAELPAEEYERYLASETILYVLHGLLHFAGYDDELPEDRREMFDMAAEVLASLGWPVVPYSGEKEDS